MRALVVTQQLQLSLPPHVSVTALAALPPYRQLLVAARRLSCFQACPCTTSNRRTYMYT